MSDDSRIQKNDREDKDELEDFDQMLDEQIEQLFIDLPGSMEEKAEQMELFIDQMSDKKLSDYPDLIKLSTLALNLAHRFEEEGCGDLFARFAQKGVSLIEEASKTIEDSRDLAEVENHLMDYYLMLAYELMELDQLEAGKDYLFKAVKLGEKLEGSGLLLKSFYFNYGRILEAYASYCREILEDDSKARKYTEKAKKFLFAE